jgi:hypothetical protein
MGSMGSEWRFSTTDHVGYLVGSDDGGTMPFRRM